MYSEVASKIKRRPSLGCTTTECAVVASLTFIAMMQWLNWCGDAHSGFTNAGSSAVMLTMYDWIFSRLNIARIRLALSLQSPYAFVNTSVAVCGM